MERFSCLLFIFLLSTVPSAVAATPILLQILGTGRLEGRVDCQAVDYEKSWQQSDLLVKKAWRMLSENGNRIKINEIDPSVAASGSDVEESLFSQVPEPTTIIFLGFGLLVLAGTIRKAIRLR
jgi:hypothetical protein